MVFCEIRDGLGNQLFQYAAGRALAHRLETNLRLETRWYDKVPLRTLALNRFHIQASFATFLEQMILRRWDRSSYAKVTGQWQRWVPMLGLTVLNDPKTRFEEKVLSVQGNVYLRGYWQSERYFSSINDQIREELTLRAEPDSINQALINEINAHDAVSLHVRRGDYVAVASFANTFGTCGLDYYREAIAQMQSRISKPHFFIFSDDPQWTRDNIKIQGPSTYVTHNTGVNDVEDLRLMSHCKHFIIANSSFSWWGAWLCRHVGKLVIAPKRWYAGYETPHTIPSEWIKL